MPGTTLEALSTVYALWPDQTMATTRRAQKLCAPCCYIVSKTQEKYCDAVSIPGGTYCAQHEPAVSAQKASKHLFGFAFSKVTPWRSREWA